MMTGAVAMASAGPALLTAADLQLSWATYRNGMFLATADTALCLRTGASFAADTSTACKRRD